jgi:hypothetical protein
MMPAGSRKRTPSDVGDDDADVVVVVVVVVVVIITMVVAMAIIGARGRRQHRRWRSPPSRRWHALPVALAAGSGSRDTSGGFLTRFDFYMLYVVFSRFV